MKSARVSKSAVFWFEPLFRRPAAHCLAITYPPPVRECRRGAAGTPGPPDGLQPPPETHDSRCARAAKGNENI